MRRGQLAMLGAPTGTARAGAPVRRRRRPTRRRTIRAAPATERARARRPDPCREGRPPLRPAPPHNQLDPRANGACTSGSLQPHERPIQMSLQEGLGKACRRRCRHAHELHIPHRAARPATRPSRELVCRLPSRADRGAALRDGPKARRWQPLAARAQAGTCTPHTPARIWVVARMSRRRLASTVPPTPQRPRRSRNDRSHTTRSATAWTPRRCSPRWT